MLYAGIKIEETQSIIVILGENNKLFIQHDIIIANTSTAVQSFVDSMRQGGLTPEKICFAINPAHVDDSEAFKSFVQLFAQADYELRIINVAAQGENFIVVTKSCGADETTTGIALLLKREYARAASFLHDDYRQEYFFTLNFDKYLELVGCIVFIAGACYFLYHGIYFAIIHFLVGLGMLVLELHNFYIIKKGSTQHKPFLVIDKHGIQKNYKTFLRFFYPLSKPVFIPWEQVRNIETYFPAMTKNSERRIRIYTKNYSEITFSFYYVSYDHVNNYHTFLFYWKLFRDNGQ